MTTLASTYLLPLLGGGLKKADKAGQDVLSIWYGKGLI